MTVCRLHREIARKMTPLIQVVQEALGHSVTKAKRLIIGAKPSPAARMTATH